MTLDCRNDCVEPLAFPKTLFNRPGLSHIVYRIGTYSDFRLAMLGALDRDPVLEAWTHRKPDDPGIALVESAAILGDILTFYQELYANEAYLGTAVQRESIADLVRLLGYRLSPGLGGTGTFAFGVKNPTPPPPVPTPITIPAGFPLKAQVTKPDKQSDFQTSEEIQAYPHLSQFNLYRRRLAPAAITAGLTSLEILAVNGALDTDSIAALNLQKGDRLLIVPDLPALDPWSTPKVLQDPAEMLVVSKVETVLDRAVVHFEGALTQNRVTFVTAYKLGRTFKHFGANAPAMITSLDSSHQAVQTATNYLRLLYADHVDTSSSGAFYSPLPRKMMPLDQSVSDLAAGGKLIIQANVQNLWAAIFGLSNIVPVTVAKTIVSVGTDSLSWGNLTGPSTRVEIDSPVLTTGSIGWEVADIRQVQFHETKSGPITLRAPSAWTDGPMTDGSLAFFGTYDEAVLLAGRRLALVGPSGESQVRAIASKPVDFSLAGRDTIHKWMWPITLDKPPDDLRYEDFDETKPAVTVYGNLADATQGKQERDAVLGNGDSRQTFQTFKVPKAPVTYLYSPGDTPPEVPELDIYVDNKLWTRVASLFGRGPDEEIYIVREDADNNSWVQFGDGKTGKRLPSGLDNVVAKYRTGTGAFGPLKPETTVQLAGKVNRLDKGWLPGIVSGGADPESGDNAREAAPMSVQSLDRLVSLRDIEAEALAIAGVDKVSASWDLLDNISSVHIVVLMETGREGELQAVQDILTAANRSRGPWRFPILVLPGTRKFVYVDAQIALQPGLLPDPTLAAAKAALGVSGDSAIDGARGLFGVRNRRFGESEYATRIEAILQNVPGVAWSKVAALGEAIGTDPDPAKLTLPDPKPPAAAKIACAADRILALSAAHLSLTIAAAPAREAC